MISGRTKIYGIFGYPVEHTFSPGMHNAAFKKLGMDACYVPFAVHPDRLGEAARAILPLGLGGLNVTVPHKEKIIPYLDELSEEARLIGAVGECGAVNAKPRAGADGSLQSLLLSFPNPDFPVPARRYHELIIR